MGIIARTMGGVPWGSRRDPRSARLSTHFLLDHGARRLALEAGKLAPRDFRTVRAQRAQAIPSPTKSVFYPLEHNTHKRYQPLAIRPSRPCVSIVLQHPRASRGKAAPIKASTHILFMSEASRRTPPRRFDVQVPGARFFFALACAGTSTDAVPPPSSSISGSVLWRRAANAV
jgi:hypothetical protein